MKINKLKSICKCIFLTSLLLILSGSLSMPTLAMPSYELGKRNLKLGNTYREAGNIGLALKYLNKGKNVFKKQQNKEEQYWFAVANEYLFYFYRDIDDMESAQEHIEVANNLYNKLIAQKDGSATAVKQLQNAQNFGANRQLTGIPQNSNNTVINYPPTYGQALPPSNIKINLDNKGLNSFPNGYISTNEKNAIELEVSLENNQFETIPEIVMERPNLTELNMAGNRLKTCNLRDLHSLKYLNLSDNQITGIGESIGTLLNLEQIILSNNPQLVAISSEIQNLRQLKVLDVRNTALPARAINELISLLPAASVLYDVNNIQAQPVDSDTDSFWEIDTNNSLWEEDTNNNSFWEQSTEEEPN